MPPIKAPSSPVTPPTSGLPGAGDSPGVLTEFYAYAPTFSGGVRVAAGDVNGDGHPDIITGAGVGGGPHVKEIDGVTGDILSQFYAFAANYTGGVYVSAGDFAGNGKSDVVVGSGVAAAEVKLYNDAGATVRDYSIDDPTAIFGVHVATADIDGDGKADLVLSVGTNVEVRDPLTDATIQTITPFDPTVLGGVFVG